MDNIGFKKAAVMLVAAVFISHAFFITSLYAVTFSMPEKLIYDLTWTGFKAGTATLELKKEGNVVKIISTAQSASWVSAFYKVDDRVESTMLHKHPDSFFQPSCYRLKIREGKHIKDNEVLFDFDAGKAFYTDHIKNEKKEFGITPPVFDPLSGFYYMRSLELSIGKPSYITIFDNKKVWNVEVQVLRRERISLPVGLVKTIVVKPLMKSEGIFSRKGDILIWLTDDEKHIPVKMQTKVAIGSITATLVRGLY